MKARIRDVGARRPFPNIPEHLPRLDLTIGGPELSVGARVEMAAIREIARNR
jgi:hypothetical protein